VLPKMEPVESGTVSGMTYDAQEAKLYLRFHGGRVYAYHDVPLEVFAKLKASPSKGRFVGQHIRGKFRYKEEPKGE
jgi:lysyl-tRNA synthetase class 2